MKTALSSLLPALLPALFVAAAASAAPGDITTLQRGHYVCSVPGDATGAPVREVAEHNFTITGASSYRSAQGGGTYLRIGDMVTFTSGPRKDMKLHQHGSGLLQWVTTDGSLGRIRCSRTSR